MKTLLSCYRPTGEVRSIFTDTAAPLLRKTGAFPQRASRVEVIETGPHRGLFYVDFSLLADVTHQPEHRVCLATPFASHKAAVAAEVAWIEQHWILS